MDHNSLVHKYIMELVYCFSVLSLGAFSLLSHHLLCAGIDKASAELKFQKVRERTIDREEKKREKKEKKHRDKKDKRKREESSSLKNGEQVHKKRKHEGSVLCGKDSNSMEAGKCTVEQLEKSSLSEEHGLPSSIPEPCESSESTQNSSKSRKLEGVGTASRSNGSIVLRFKLPLKQQVPEPVPSSSALPGLKVPPLKVQKDPEPVSSSAFPGLKIPLKMQKDPEPVPSSALPCLKLPLKMHKVREPVPSCSSPGLKLPFHKHKVPEPVPASALPGLNLPLHKHKVPEPVPSRGLSGLKLPLKTHKSPERPSRVLPGLNFASKKHNDREPVPSIVLPGPNFPLKKHKDTVSVSTTALPGPKSKDLLPVPCDEEACGRQVVPECVRGNEEPCFSGRTNEAPSGKLDGEAGRSNSSSRQSKRNRRSDEIDNHLSNLLSSLNPLLLQGIEIADDTDNQDWLFGSLQQQHKDPGASCGVDTGAGGLGLESAATSYQPRSCFMPEFNCYQLPYVFPF